MLNAFFGTLQNSDLTPMDLGDAVVRYGSLEAVMANRERDNIAPFVCRKGKPVPIVPGMQLIAEVNSAHKYRVLQTCTNFKSAATNADAGTRDGHLMTSKYVVTHVPCTPHRKPACVACHRRTKYKSMSCL